MRDLTSQEIQHVYGAGSAYSVPKKEDHKKHHASHTKKHDTHKKVAKNTKDKHTACA